ncbi:MAG: DUF1298 domain-containing protein [Deltaproteobacteria bacterium]|nr:DUF1298 domain-containing protein [Deltaproteobacteria bacterium]
MERMSGFDALFVYDESPNEPQHTLKIAILGRKASRAYSFERAKRALGERLAVLPPFRRRVLRVPFDLHHPLWIEDRPVDLAHHVRRATIPSPGGRRELCAAISEIASTPLDPTRPLWEVWFLVEVSRGANKEDWIDRLPPFLVKGLKPLMTTAVRLTGASAGITVSGVVGPKEKLQTPAGPIDDFVSVGHMKYGAGLNFTAWSYAGNLNVALYACADAIPDLGRIADHVDVSFRELLDATLARRDRAA